jgi:predicted nucleic acid-binding protein
MAARNTQRSASTGQGRMMLLDSNIIIYSAKPENSFLRQFIAENEPSVSVISYVEALGFINCLRMKRRILRDFLLLRQ